MSSFHLCAVEFIGGPFDGHVHLASFPPDELAPIASLPVNDNMFRMLDNKTPGAKCPATSVAIYELEAEQGEWRYRFCGATSAREFELQQWMG